MATEIPRSEDDFIRMQQEAIRRVREMQQRARRTLEDAGVPLAPGEPEPVQAPPPAPPEPEPGPVAPPPSPFPPSFFANRTEDAPRPAPAPPPEGRVQPERRVQPGGPVLPGLPPGFHLSLDREQILLLVLMYLIYQDHGDRLLLLAIAYILL